jgi:hypothetical protein
MRLRLDYAPDQIRSPLSLWVHRGVDAHLYRATVFDPPLPRAVPGKGFPIWVLEHKGREICFVSPEEIAHAVDILGRRILPSPRDLGRPHQAVNSHWLSRLHSQWKPWKTRQQMVKLLRAAPRLA